MAQDSSNSLSETLDSSLSLADDAIADHHHQSSPSSSTASSLSDPSLSRNSSFSRLNAKAPEFVPRSSSSSSLSSLSMPQQQPSTHGLIHVYPGPTPAFHVPIHGAGGGHVPHHHPHHVPVQYHHNHNRPVQVSVAVQAQQPVAVVVEPDHVPPLRNGLSEEATLKILNQVEYYFSDLNLATTDHLMKFINKDIEGYVPINVVASFKKIKAAINSNSQLASILRNSNKLVVSEDGKKVKRHRPLTGSEMEELQSRIVVAENLPEDHCHQNLMKIFSAVGSVKTIRTCPPQTSNGGASSAGRSGKADGMLFSNKLHAFVEYESVELAEKAVADLNDEANWRSGLRVRLLLRRTSKSARGKRIDHEGNANLEEDDTSTSEQLQPNDKHLEDPAEQLDSQSHEHAGDENLHEKEGGQKKGRSRGRGKGRGRAQYHHHNNRGSHIGTPPSSNLVNNHTEQPSIPKQPPGPRMPDGTRGFSMGRGKPITVNIAS
ncbi:la-related protein 6B [Rhododendron vialii]|uniref:la-related protein 6B n=1 Tax=Rhododendron vialii TaxID=182163 RepID=UPI00265E8AC1|nr:la-related protein 6B [Rhododendron vialii]